MKTYMNCYLPPSIMTKTARGFTLIEVLIAVTILAFVIMGVFAIYTQCTAEIRRAKNRTIATNCTQEMLEMILSNPHDIANYHELTTAEEPPADNPVSADIFKWKTSLQALSADTVGMISVVNELYSRRVEVKVTYTNYGRAMTSILTVKIARPER